MTILGQKLDLHCMVWVENYGRTVWLKIGHLATLCSGPISMSSNWKPIGIHMGTIRDPSGNQAQAGCSTWDPGRAHGQEPNGSHPVFDLSKKQWGVEALKAPRTGREWGMA